MVGVMSFPPLNELPALFPHAFHAQRERHLAGISAASLADVSEFTPVV
jgi:hypothetical protein